MPSEEYVRAVLLPNTRVLEAMQAHTFPLQVEKGEIKEALINQFTREESHVTNRH
jgi:hypothetical protein